ncbi:hypothetical protein BS78_10G055600 [Paspalum vaginatum]|nr:hypothetical protein BS78_10G055600 [Paspalum vaginatum]KAJ1258185.1 hypothetical protein BS78_10G055600 [Paspalum vaginatum]
MELELGLALPAPPRPPGGKRVFGEAFGDAKATLPLFFVREDDGGGGDRGGSDHETSSKKKRLVGWPPVKCAHRRGLGRYVKVSMEGVAIGRKVDVSIHGSYGDLLRTLRRMFHPCGCEGGAGCFVVTYEDGEGDWLLVGDDVPWEAFAKSVKRLKILA